MLLLPPAPKNNVNSCFTWLSRWFVFLLVGGVLVSFVFLSTLYSSIYIIGNWSTLRPKPVILLWTTFFSRKWLPNRNILDCLGDCTLTNNRSALNDSTAIVFHARDVDLLDLPPWSISRKWILYNKEAPPNTPVKILKALSGKIYWTASYRRDSDIPSPYGMVVPISVEAKAIDLGFTGEFKKKYLVCWIVSHCSTNSHREDYARVLGRHVSMAVFGKCGNKTCPDPNASRCYQHIAKDCYFYLSFENSICTDYATEKLFHTLRTDMVPIVMGGANYSQILPEHSYIDALDFLNPKDLAVYLLELQNDPVRFKRYHKWKKIYTLANVDYRWVCDICRKLYSIDSFYSAQLHKDLSSWWFDGKCSGSWTDRLKIS